MTIYGPDRYKKYVFYDGKSVARSPLSNKTSTFDERDPKSYKSHRVLPSEKKVTLATLERNDNLRSRSEQRHVFYDGKRVAPSPLSSKTSTFDPDNPRNRRFAREGRTFFLNVRPSRTKHHFLARSRSNTAKLAFYTRGRKIFCTTFQNTQYYRRECIKRGPKGKFHAPYLAAPRPILDPEKSILHR